jgi:hypothetical protein
MQQRDTEVRERDGIVVCGIEGIEGKLENRINFDAPDKAPESSVATARLGSAPARLHMARRHFGSVSRANAWLVGIPWLSSVQRAAKPWLQWIYLAIAHPSISLMASKPGEPPNRFKCISTCSKGDTICRTQIIALIISMKCTWM